MYISKSFAYDLNGGLMKDLLKQREKKINRRIFIEFLQNSDKFSDKAGNYSNITNSDIPEHQLACVAAGETVPFDDANVKLFAYLLGELSRKTGIDKKVIGYMLIIGKEILLDKYDIRINLLKYTSGLNNYIENNYAIDFAAEVTDFTLLIKNDILSDILNIVSQGYSD